MFPIAGFARSKLFPLARAVVGMATAWVKDGHQRDLTSTKVKEDFGDVLTWSTQMPIVDLFHVPM